MSLRTLELQRHFEIALELAFKKEDSISVVADALVRALSGKILRSQLDEAYERNNL